MLRKLIALLVLVTGLAAASQPAHAVQLNVESVRTALDTGYACAVQAGQVSGQPSIRVQRDDNQPRTCPRPPRVVLIVPTVMLQADRARE
jgi:hypothetical protein